MHRDPAFYLDTNRADLFLVDPDSAVDVEPLTLKIEFFQGVDYCLFEVAHPSVEVFAVLGDVEHWVGDELSRAVASNIATAVCWDDFDALGFIPLGGVKQVLGVEACSESNDGIVLKEE